MENPIRSKTKKGVRENVTKERSRSSPEVGRYRYLATNAAEE